MNAILWACRLPGRLLGGLLFLLVRFYQYGIGPFLPKVCIYEPSCSNYMLIALHYRGPILGTLLGLWRICRCHPFAKGGWDPVPGAEEPSRRWVFEREGGERARWSPVADETAVPAAPATSEQESS